MAIDRGPADHEKQRNQNSTHHSPQQEPVFNAE